MSKTLVPAASGAVALRPIVTTSNAEAAKNGRMISRGRSAMNKIACVATLALACATVSGFAADSSRRAHCRACIVAKEAISSACADILRLTAG